MIYQIVNPQARDLFFGSFVKVNSSQGWNLLLQIRDWNLVLQTFVSKQQSRSSHGKVTYDDLLCSSIGLLIFAMGIRNLENAYEKVLSENKNLKTKLPHTAAEIIHLPNK